jgi:hypothetical protein
MPCLPALGPGNHDARIAECGEGVVFYTFEW